MGGVEGWAVALDLCLACTRSWVRSSTVQQNEWVIDERERWGAGTGVWRCRGGSWYRYQMPPGISRRIAGYPQELTAHSFTRFSCRCGLASGVNLTLTSSQPAAAHTLLSFRLSQVPGGCPELRHIWPLQKNPHFSCHSEWIRGAMARPVHPYNTR